MDSTLILVNNPFLIRSGTSQSSSYPIFLTRLGGPCPRPNPHLKLWKCWKSNPRPKDNIIIIIIKQVILNNIFRPCGKESTEVRKSQIKGKESENSYQELKRSQKGQAHTNTRKLNRDISTGTAVFLNLSIVCACPFAISSIPGKSFHFPFP